mmetsp:Transcript_45887/g.90437  ORF Transcript_45887/g.90437 Transcript_45887/m.90437 type:complete len:461 (+) Transcript_45887:80-1462(+)|eukprot:CAMPEP_0175120962 /NCGR_PEP_ID=MMETSP0087-20121206/905_1 /TAXON_ID=136419 /ORGANISM="Unknown Unknown, Strain D1" /LENGTH=460 /DNA_ID=CAMNT_0016402453 /DNA_START=65 /DNA_END=1447 /DNA_ORIENTATION=-
MADTDTVMIDDSKKRKLEIDEKEDVNKKAAMEIDTQHQKSGTEDSINPDYLKVYYDRLFPCSNMFKWLSYSDPDMIKKREFSFTLKDDVYIRYCSFSTKDEFKKGLTDKIPYKIDIGAVFNAAPKNHDSIPSFKPVSKELVLDIDMTDYDDIRTCCSKADICSRCWPLMVAAIKVVDTALREDFAFKHIMWVYSGRRGIHCWVCDKSARMMSNQARTAVIEYLSVYMGNDKNAKPEISQPVHPALQRAADILEPYFQDELVEGQNYFCDRESCEKYLEHMGVNMDDQKARDLFSFSDHDFATNTSLGIYKQVKAKFLKWQAATAKKRGNRDESSGSLIGNIQALFLHCYPRLDINVSKQLNHLLKSPFCVHPKTGRVCVPIDPAVCERFDPFSVPTLNELYLELNKAPVTGNESKTKSWMNTSMAPHIKYFQNFVKTLEEENRAEIMEEGKHQGVSIEDW